MGRGARAAGLLLSVACALSPAIARAASDPNLDWWTIETPHFRVHYPRSIEPVGERVAMLAESIHDRLSGPLGHAASRTEVVITDDTDAANGSATALPYNTIRLYATAPDDLSPLGDYDDWYLSLFTHEYTHILHVDNISGPARVVNAVLGKTYAPNQAQPRWLLEGLAVVAESQHTSGGRIRSSLFDAHLRADVLDDNIATIDQFTSTPIRWPGGSLWYLYGSRFLRWISDIYGPNTMRAVAADYGGMTLPLAINRAIRRVTGKTYEELYEGFKDSIKRLYKEQVAEVERRGLREGERITSHGRDVYYPRFIPKTARRGAGEEIVYYRADAHERAGLYRIPLAANKDKKRPSELWARTASTASPAFGDKGDLYYNSVNLFRNSYYREDLYRIPAKEDSKTGDEPFRARLTEARRAYYPDVSPNGRSITYVVNNGGTTHLAIADLTATGEIKRERLLVRSARFEQAYTPRFSPDGKTIAYSAWTTGGYRDVRLVDVATGKFTELFHDRAMEMAPVFSSDGKTLYFSSDRSGIFNIYAFDLEKHTLAQVTNVRTLAVQPAVSEDGKTLVYVGYTTSGYDLFAMPLDRSRFLPAPPPRAERPAPPPEPAPASYKKKRYNPLPTLAPRNYFFELKPGSYSSNALTFTTTGGDAVGLHSLDAALTLDPGAPAPSFSFGYSYNRLPFNLSVRAFHSVVPRGFKLGDKDTTYDERNYGVTAGFSFNPGEEFAGHSLGFSVTVASFYGSFPVGAGLDPYSQINTDPQRGTLAVMHLGYSYSNVEGSIQTAGPARGVSIRLGMDYADTSLGSSYTVRTINGTVTGYLSMPWPAYQTLAMRLSGAISKGSYPRGGAYSVGGYDLGGIGPTTILSGAFDGAFVLRGYPARVYAGSAYVLANLEYRMPIVRIDRGPSTLPFYFRRLDANVFWDMGGAFEKLDVRSWRFFKDKAILYAPGLHTAIGAEVWLGFTLAYILQMQLRVGYAYGFSPEAIPNGQPYGVLSGAF